VPALVGRWWVYARALHDLAGSPHDATAMEICDQSVIWSFGYSVNSKANGGTGAVAYDCAAIESDDAARA